MVAKGKEMKIKELKEKSSVILLFIFLVSGTCFANAGIPMFFIQFPFALFAAVPVIAIEALVLKKMMEATWREVILDSTKANFFSTIIGYPLSWGIAFGIELLTTGGSCGPGFGNFKDSLVTIIVEAAWLCPNEPFPKYAVPGALLVLLTIAWILSVFIEYWVVSFKRENKKKYWKPVITMNIASYLVLLILAVFFMVG
ncbi:MAG: hypothetical protein GX556_03555 [Fibrobacter sp.]|nr:hypothetical protein [Fibrobacter sp.]